MAVKKTGLNIAFPIYNADGTSFHNLVIRKASYESVVMSLGDKISGDVYYKDNCLQVSMHEVPNLKRLFLLAFLLLRQELEQKL